MFRLTGIRMAETIKPDRDKSSVRRVLFRMGITILLLVSCGAFILVSELQAERDDQLYQAIRASEVAGVESALAAGADPNATHQRQRQGFLEHLKTLIRRRDDGSRSMLYVARNPQIVEALLKYGARVRVYAPPVVSSDLQAAPHSTLHMLLETGCIPQLPEINVYLLLINAQDDQIDDIIRHGGSIDAQEPNGHTALMVSTTAQHTQILLDHGARASVKNRRGMTALQLCQQKLASGTPGVTSPQELQKIIELLKEAEAKERARR